MNIVRYQEAKMKNYLLEEVRKNELIVRDELGTRFQFRIKPPWTQFLKFLRKFDQLNLEDVDGIIDETGYLIIEPHVLIAVTTAIQAISCPRKVYVKQFGAEEPLSQRLIKRSVEGNLLHKVFSYRMSGMEIEKSIELAIEGSHLELVTSGISSEEITDYLNQDATVLHGVPIQGLTELDCQDWRFGLSGKFDGLTKTRVIELKTSIIPETYPWPSHNIQMSTYLNMISELGDYDASVLYVRDGQMGIKQPSEWDHYKTIVGRNHAYLIINGRYTPKVLRGDEAKECNSCFLKQGCFSLCSGLETQRDCELCYHNVMCDKNTWNSEYLDRFNKLSLASIHEDNEQSIEQYQYSKILDLDVNNSLKSKGFIISTTSKLAESKDDGIVATQFRFDSNVTRFRNGDLARAYPRSSATETMLYHTVTILNLDKHTISLESVNSLPDHIVIVPYSHSLNLNGRRSLYQATIAPSSLMDTVMNMRNDRPFSPHVTIKSRQLTNPLQKYNLKQVEAINLALQTPDIAIIQGPAGTGKTSIIIEIIRQALFEGNSILCSAYTNMAIDNIGLLLKQDNINFLRLGRKGTINTKLQNYNPENKQQLYVDMINKKRGIVVLSTTSTLGRQNYSNLYFDITILDEAAQMTELDTIKTLNLTKKIILVGDHKQLQPIVRSQFALDLDFQTSLFEKLVDKIQDRFVLLDEQYRMNGEILSLPNRFFYGGKLKSANKTIEHQTLDYRLTTPLEQLTTSPFQVILIKNIHLHNFKYVNLAESSAILTLLTDLFLNVKNVSTDDIGIITTFRAQVAYLRGLVPDVLIDTVDRFQGSEKDIIIYSSVIIHETPIISDIRRINVALTRAKKKFILLLTEPESGEISKIHELMIQDAEKREILQIVDYGGTSQEETTLFEQHEKFIRSFYDKEVSMELDSRLQVQSVSYVESNFYMGSTPLNLVKYETNIPKCKICWEDVRKAVVCLACRSNYHPPHLRNWVEQDRQCPVCKNTIVVIE